MATQPQKQKRKAKIGYKLGQEIGSYHNGMSNGIKCFTSFSEFPSKDVEEVVSYKFEDSKYAHRLKALLESLDPSRCVRPRFSAKVNKWYHVVGSSRNGDSLADWCNKNYDKFWKLSNDNDGDIVSLSDVAKKLFRNILQGLQVYHEANIGHGNLKDGVMVTQDGEVTLFNEEFASSGSPLEFPKIMILDVRNFEELFDNAINIVERRFEEEKSIKIKGNQHPAVEAFKMLYREMHRYQSTKETLMDFTFYLRNNPLFLNTTESFMFIKKYIDLNESDWKLFQRVLPLNEGPTDLINWGALIKSVELQEVFDFMEDNYDHPGSASYFVRNSYRHVRDKHPEFDDGMITDMIMKDLPFLLPRWWLALVCGFGRNSQACEKICQKDLTGFLQKQPSFMD